MLVNSGTLSLFLKNIYCNQWYILDANGSTFDKQHAMLHWGPQCRNPLCYTTVGLKLDIEFHIN